MKSTIRLLALALILVLPLAQANAQTPVSLDPIDDVSLVEGETLTVDVGASDPDAGTIEVSASIPSFATLDEPTSTTGTDRLETTITVTPADGDAGMYDATVTATSDGDTAQETFAITVTAANTAPVTLDPIEDVTLEEGESTTVPVKATDPDQNEIQLTATLPDFATLDEPTSGTGTETLETTITIAPGEGTAGMYDASVTATSDGDTAMETFLITVIPPPLDASAELIGAFNVHKKFICFKVKPVEGNFDLRDADLSSITLSYGGASIQTVRPTHLATECEEECPTCDGDGDGEMGEDVRAEYGDGDPEDCDPSHIMACFSMSDLRTLFDGATLPESFASASIEGDLADGERFVAWIGGKHVERGAKGENGDGGSKLSLRVHPNPMNPKADISFTIARSGRVKVSIYDLAGRLVKTVGNGELAAGPHTMSWDGSSESGGHVASGVYFVKVETATIDEVQRVTVLK